MKDKIEYPVHYNGDKLDTVVATTNISNKDWVINAKKESILQFPCFPYLK